MSTTMSYQQNMKRFDNYIIVGLVQWLLTRVVVDFNCIYKVSIIVSC